MYKNNHKKKVNRLISRIASYISESKILWFFSESLMFKVAKAISLVNINQHSISRTSVRLLGISL